MNDKWWRNKCALYAGKLDDWTREQPRNTKTVKQILSAVGFLKTASKSHNDQDAYDALQALDAYVLSDQHTIKAQDVYTKICFASEKK